MINAEAPFRWMWDRLPPSEQDEVKEFFKGILEEEYWIIKDYEQLEEIAKRELNMVSKDNVREIAAEELRMIDDPEEEK